MQCQPRLLTWRQESLFISISLLVITMSLGEAFQDTHKDKHANLVSIEDSRGLGNETLFDKVPENNSPDINIHLSRLIESSGGLNHRESDDEDDVLFSGSGSGSGDDHVLLTHQDNIEHMTPIHTILKAAAESLPFTNGTGSRNEEQKGTSKTHMIVDLKQEFTEAEKSYGITLEDSDSMNDHPGTPSTDSNHILNTTTWSLWSDWLATGITLKVRVQTCNADRTEVKEAACPVARMQIKSCDSNNKSRCGNVQNLSTSSSEGRRPDTHQSAQVPAAPAISAIVKDKPNLDMCLYSLYDNYHQKYVFDHWNHTEMKTNSRDKRWCDKSTGQYVVMTTPREHCLRFHRNLCKASDRCLSEKPTNDWGDLAEGCWHDLVYGGMLPVGLSNYHTTKYFICQKFADHSRLGKIFVNKEANFGTLYDTRLKSPVFSVSKVTRLGDHTWPVTDFFIEHGLLENQSWLFWNTRKGILALRDVDRCKGDVCCGLGQRQVLPSDYQDSKDSLYVPTHLMWPELMPPDTEPKLTTFTLTNIAPLHRDLYQEWHATIAKVRQYTVEQCGVPAAFDLTFLRVTEKSSLHTNRATMFFISGIIPSADPIVTTGHGIHVPHTFWLSGCCVKQYIGPTDSGDYKSDIDSTYGIQESWDDLTLNDIRKNVTSFSMHILNVPGNHVVSTPVHQLELLLGDIYQFTSSDLDVSLFPGHDGTCNDIKNDVSFWFL